MDHWLDEVTYTNTLPLSVAGHTFEEPCPKCPDDHPGLCSECRLQADNWAGRLDWQAFQDWLAKEDSVGEGRYPVGEGRYPVGEGRYPVMEKTERYTEVNEEWAIDQLNRMLLCVYDVVERCGVGQTDDPVDWRDEADASPLAEVKR
ncbi:MAG: hypothetical protein ACREKR_12095 [Candidatus Methylomirabilales bacterium]